MIRLISCYQRDIQIFAIYFIQIQQDLYDFTQQPDLGNLDVKLLSEHSQKISECIFGIRNFLTRQLNRLLNLPSREITV
jgi:hypothetical protein